MPNWDNAVVVDPKELHDLRKDNAGLRIRTRHLRLAVIVIVGLNAATASALYWKSVTLTDAARRASEFRRTAERSSVALAALAKSHDNILAATQQAPSVGTKSWGRRFTVTKYLPFSPAYGKTNDGLTATMKKADPKQRIVAVDPKLIPYGSSVWVEGLGWYRAEDCGSAIKGFRLDLLTATEKDAMEFGKQERFVIVVPAEKAGAKTSA